MTLNDLIKMLKLQEGFCDDTRLVISNNDPDDEYSIHYGSCKYAKDSNVFNMYGRRDVVSWRDISNGFHIVIDGERYDENQKFYFNVSNDCSDGGEKGRVKLTMDQALAVAYATNSVNWLDHEHDSYSYDIPVFAIDLDSAIPVEES
jgi:hypothetical protein